MPREQPSMRNVDLAAFICPDVLGKDGDAGSEPELVDRDLAPTVSRPLMAAAR